MSFVCDEQVWLKVAGQTFGRFYDDPRIHLQVQLEGKRWFCEHVVGDMAPDPQMCGFATQHFETLGQQLGVAAIDGPGTFADHGRYLRELGPGFSLDAQTDHSILEHGSPAQIDAMMHGLLSPGARRSISRAT